MSENKDWAVLKQWYRDDYGLPERIFHVAIYKPNFGSKIKELGVIADNLTKEEALALKKLLGE